jgi:hypothetical protein
MGGDLGRTNYEGRTMKRNLILITILGLAMNAIAAAQTCTVAPAAAAPGESVQVKCDTLTPGAASVGLQSGAEKSSRVTVYAGVLAKGQTTVPQFQVPASLKEGWYDLYATVGTPTAPESPIARLQVMGPVTVTAIYPDTQYPPDATGYDFNIVGTNFSLIPEENRIEIRGQKLIVPKKCPTPPPSGTTPPANVDVTPPPDPCLDSVESTELKFKGFHPTRFLGPTQFVVHVGSGSSTPVAVSFSYASQQLVALAAAAIFFGLAFLFYGLIRKGIGSVDISGQKFGVTAALFLDRETNSYSLSKFQVIAWTAVVVYSYVYLFLCRTLVQGNFGAFPGVAQNIPQLFFVSAGTTVAATAITSNYGSKGGGPVKPTPADFISSGGFVAGDRFQFFIWTIVGCIGYLFLVLRNDPFSLKDLPSLPDNFLYLMGVSSAGYLGGKLVRKPGPVLKSLSVGTVTARDEQAAKPAVMTINLKGETLDQRGSIKVDDITLRADMFAIALTPNGPQPDAQTGFCAALTVTLLDADKYVEGPHTLTLVNTDGQASSATFPVDGLVIDSVPDVTAGAVPAPVVVKGKNFADGMRAWWTAAAPPPPPGAAAVAAPAVAPVLAAITNLKDATELTVALTPGQQTGKGKLTLESAIGLKASKDVVVKAPPAPQ